MLKPIVKVKRGSADFEVMKQRIEATAKMFKDRMPNIQVGLPKNSTPYPDGTSVIMVGFWNEFGSDDGAVPSRPWLRNGAHKNRDEWIALARRIVKSCIQKGTDPINAFALLGLRMENNIKASIVEGPWEPNQGAYAAAKAAKGKTKPLIVTGHMRASVRYIITEGRPSDNS